MRKIHNGVKAGLLMGALCVFGILECAAEIAVKNGEKVAFLGDSITQQGAGSPIGYVKLVLSGLEANGVKVVPVFAGIGGHKSNDMLARLDKDVLEKKPDVMTLSCGVNDVAHGARGVPLDEYKKNITAIVEKTQAAGTRVVILTATMIREDPENDSNKKLKEYNEFLQKLAAEKKCPVADLNKDMQEALKDARAKMVKPANGNYLTSDGVHMNVYGNQMMALGVLRALGLDDAQIAKAKEAWLDMPNACNIVGVDSVTLRQYNKISDVAAKENLSANDYLNREFKKIVESALKGK